MHTLTHAHTHARTHTHTLGVDIHDSVDREGVGVSVWGQGVGIHSVGESVGMTVLMCFESAC